MEEIWIDIKGYEGRYQVSNMGRVRSLDRLNPHGGDRPHALKGKVLKSTTNKSNPYPIVTLTGKVTRIHILVAEHFIGPKPFPGAEVNHKNGIKTDCAETNLEWVTGEEQMRHAYDTGLNGRRLLTTEQIREIKKAFAEAEGTSTYGLGQRLADKFGVDRHLISRIKKGRTGNHVV